MVGSLSKPRSGRANGGTLAYLLCLAALGQTLALPLLGRCAAALSPLHGHVVVGAATPEETAELLRHHDHFDGHDPDHDHSHPAAGVDGAARPLGGPRVVIVAGGGAGRLWSLLSLPDLTATCCLMEAPAAFRLPEAGGAAWRLPAPLSVPPLLPPPRAA